MHEYSFHVSEAGKCLRFLFFTRTIGRLEDVSFKPEVVAGRKIHFEFQNSYREIDRTARTEERAVFIHEKFVITGRADIVTDGEVLEIKTVRKLPKEAVSEHISQINLYMKLCNRKKGRLIYIERESGKERCFKIFFDKKLFLEDIRRFEKLVEHLSEMRLPAREECRMCSFCEYLDLCEMLGD